jgi:atypical dual specificity phosphatase
MAGALCEKTAESDNGDSPMRPDTCLVLNGFGVAYNTRTVLQSVSLEVGARGVTVVVGPAGTGKSTLLRTLCGYHRALPSVRTWGKANYLGRPLGHEDSWPLLVVQHARLFTSTLLDNLLMEAPERFASTYEQKRARALAMLEELHLTNFAGALNDPVVDLPLHVQRLVSIGRIAASGAPLLCVDEPTNGIEAGPAALVIDYLQRLAEQRAVIVVLHNQREIRRLGGTLALLARGVIQELQPTASFFERPLSETGRQFVATGSCIDVSPSTSPEALAPDMRAQVAALMPRPDVASAAIGPDGFVWLLPGRLAGTPQPGIVLNIDYDLQALQRVGVTVLISLTERPLDEMHLKGYGISSLWCPVRDMEAPTIEAAKRMCTVIDQLLAKGEVVAVHCKAGLGRTGTVLAAYLIWCGASALAALETARRRQPRWVQSEAQIRFLEKFASVLGRCESATPDCALT